MFIYGVKEAGVGLAKSICNRDAAPYMLKGFVSDTSEMVNHYLMGVRVYPNDAHLVEEMKKHHAHILLVSPLRNEAIRENAAMVERLLQAGIKIFMAPEVQEWNGKHPVDHSQLREVDIEDLLPRDKIEIDLESVKQLLTERCILITGAAGSIGSEIVRQVAQFNPKRLILIDQAETPLHDIRLLMARRWPDIEAHTIVSDICMKERMEQIFATYRPG